MYAVSGTIYKNKLTKLLVENIKRDSIAVIKHKAIDLVAAQDLKYKNVKAVINCDKTIDEGCNLDGVKYLLDNKIRLYEIQDRNFFDFIQDGDYVCIDRYSNLFINNIIYGVCRSIDINDLLRVHESKSTNDLKIKYDFIMNTMMYMDDELEYFLHGKILPELETDIKGREVIIIARGRYYRDDLKAAKNFILSRKPVIISVDGGANAVTDLGLKSDIIIGDMDSVNDKSLLNCKEILIHTYSNGYSPGLNRIKAMKLRYKLLPLKGTSEDAALYTANVKGALVIYLIGSHTCIDEFLEKGRAGMGSTALLRILLGDRIIDLKGINSMMKHSRLKLYYVPAAVIIIFFISCMLLSLNIKVNFSEAYLKLFFR